MQVQYHGRNKYLHIEPKTITSNCRASVLALRKQIFYIDVCLQQISSETLRTQTWDTAH